MDLLRDAPGQEWVEVAGPIGIHQENVVARVLNDLAREGMVELRETGPLRARLPTT